MSDDLPQGWVSARLQEIVAAKKGKKPDSVRDNSVDGFVPYLDIQAIEKGEVRQFAEAKSSRLAARDDLLVVWDGARSGWVGSGIAGAIGSTIMALTPRQVESGYLRHFIASQFQSLNTNTRGTGIPHVDPEVFWNLEVPLAPLPEQRRIVAKLEKLLAKVQDCQQRLATISILLKRFRQSVLAAACSGRLTADWRRDNPDTETPVVEAETASADDEDLPANWRATRLGRFTKLVTSGSRSWAKYYSESGSIFIRAQNINSDVLNLEDIAFVKPPVGAEGLRTRVQQHDILVTITGANVTKSALIERPIRDAYVSQHVALVRLADVRLSKFLSYFVVSLAHGRKQLLEAAYGQGKPGLKLDNIRELVVGLPPLAEQQEIVRRVGGLFAVAAQIESRFSKANAHADKLTQSLLARAFRGELVPTEAEFARREGRAYKPASVLLADPEYRETKIVSGSLSDKARAGRTKSSKPNSHVRRSVRG